MRVPLLARWPGHVPAGRVVLDLGSTLDILPTAIALAGVEAPSDLVLDGRDISPALLGRGSSGRESMFFYRGTELFAARLGRFKAHFITMPAYGPDREPTRHDPPILYDLGRDPSERFDVAAEHPEELDRIRALVDEHRRSLHKADSQLDRAD